MAKKQSPPLTEDEIRSVYRNDFYKIDSPNYFRHRCTGYRKFGKKYTYKTETEKDNVRRKL